MKKNTLAYANKRVMGKVQQDFLDRKIRDLVRESPMGRKLKKLHSTLLRIGGVHTCLPVIEEDIDDILKRARTWVEPKIRMSRGQASRCHFNTSALWHENEDKLCICTGYALSDDGIWRQHSWCWWEGQDSIVETTTRRVAYYGFVMDDDEADRFYYNNCI